MYSIKWEIMSCGWSLCVKWIGVNGFAIHFTLPRRAYYNARK